MLSPTALLTALAVAQEHGGAADAIRATDLRADERARKDALQQLLERQLAGRPHEEALQEAIALGYLAGRVTGPAARPGPRLSSFLLDERLIVRGGEGRSMHHLPWFAADMFVERSLWDIDEMPAPVRNAALEKYLAALDGHRHRWSFTSCGSAFEVDSQPVRGTDGRPLAVLALIRVTHDPDDAVEKLTAREREILQLAANGLSGPDIAELLFLSATTVKTHFQNIFAKCGVSDRTAAVAKALRKGVIS